MEFPTRYDPSQEAGIYKRWEESRVFEPKGDGPAFSIVLPPPNVTGTLHIGHAVMLAIEDMMVRYHRMKGDRTLWLPGLDHAAIATQNVVEKKLKKENVQGRRTRHELGREAFLEEVGKFVEVSKARIIEQTKAMGASLDWSRLAYALDEQRSKAVREMFVRMYEAGILYRGNRVINWCPRCASTLADDEVEYKEEQTILYTFRYDEQWPEELAISTTRPETKFGDTAVALHPDDPRAAMYAGQTFHAKFGAGAPELEIRVITDQRVEREFGTGVVGVTPAHSFIDAEFASANNLPARQVITEDGKMNASLGAQYGGLLVKDARAKIVEELRSRGLITKEEPITHNLPVCYRCETPIEPLPKLQWFVAISKPFRPRTNGHGSLQMATDHGSRTADSERRGGVTSPPAGGHVGPPLRDGDLLSLKDLALDAVRSGEIKIIPERFAKEYFHWMENLRDWCISRQIWFGHRVPAKYCVHCDGENIDIAFQRPLPRSPKDDQHYANGVLGGEGGLLQHWAWKDMPAHEAFFIGPEATPIFDDACSRCGSVDFERDPDTLDTWFSSGMWTFSTLGWPGTCTPAPARHSERSEESHTNAAASHHVGSFTQVQDDARRVKSGDLAAFHPTSVLETGYDIIPFWVARMILMTEFALGEVPFKIVYLHGLVRDAKGRKMSKSLGNVVDPLDMVQKYGADAVRLALFIGTSPGQDTKLDEQKIAGYAKFVTKLWNIGRYILLPRHSEGAQATEESHMNAPANHGVRSFARAQDDEGMGIADHWILAKRDQLVRDATQAYEAYEYSKAAQMTYDFAWHDLADWYIESQKSEARSQKSEIVLLETLEIILKLLHPAMPFVTEELWQAFQRSNLLISQPWPQAGDRQMSNVKCQMFLFLQDLVTAIRQIRNEEKIEPKMFVDVTLASTEAVERSWTENAEIRALLKHFGRIRELRVTDTLPDAPRMTVRSTALNIARAA
ncbi:MAG: class I tRNA ligase family protein [Candidatus Uhrbacteria bacterium]